ncbi:hypothetical protein TeGR_g13714 [Tetraparma gracilis]|uniref:Uncharacterized protein n=1 Tax=Tetraparma gracilis TaxID=2962635 RepID=A0ABQ6MB85_9STRA|nr:hypothetical protein TeGR_g13714 [Tetraparma gracilis]
MQDVRNVDNDPSKPLTSPPTPERLAWNRFIIKFALSLCLKHQSVFALVKQDSYGKDVVVGASCMVPPNDKGRLLDLLSAANASLEEDVLSLADRLERLSALHEEERGAQERRRRKWRAAHDGLRRTVESMGRAYADAKRKLVRIAARAIVREREGRLLEERGVWAGGRWRGRDVASSYS